MISLNILCFGCPDCSGNIPWTLNRFIEEASKIHGNSYDYSHIMETQIKNKYSKIPLICRMCGYSWNPSIDNHIHQKTRCPECHGNIPWTLNRFINRAREIHDDKYDYSMITSTHIHNALSKVPIICRSCSYQWEPLICNHINKESGCPHCSTSRGYSDKQIKWIENIMKLENINIQYALSPNGEYIISGIGRVDGFCHETNTVYEYHGDFWHGNPNKYPPNDINPVSGKTYGELYHKTVERDRRILHLGYNLIVKWESDNGY